MGEKRAAIDHEGGTGSQARSHDAGDQQSPKARRQQVLAAETESVLRVLEGLRGKEAALDHGRGHQSHQRPADRAETFGPGAVKKTYAARVFILARAHRRQDVRLRHDADNPVQRQHHDEPRTYFPGRRQGEVMRGQRVLHPG